MILATPQAYLPGVAVAAAVPAPAGDSFAIHLTQPVASPVQVAWFVLG